MSNGSNITFARVIILEQTVHIPFLMLSDDKVPKRLLAACVVSTITKGMATLQNNVF